MYRAWDTANGTVVALKVLHPHLASDLGVLERFRREAQLAAAVVHPNITTIYEVGEDGNRHFIAMEYLPDSIHNVIQSVGKLPIERAVDICYQAAMALEAASRRGIIHRDIKPQNLLLAPDSTVKVTDFGIARATAMTTMTQTGALMGTPHYMSPEQAQGERADVRSDIYSLGIVLYQMLTGQLPFEANTPFEVIRQHVDERPERVRRLRSDIPGAVERIVIRCLEKDPSRRYTTPGEMARALADAVPGAGRARSSEPRRQVASMQPAPPVPPMRGRPELRRPGTTLMQSWARARRSRWLWLVSGLAVVITIAAIGFGADGNALMANLLGEVDMATNRMESTAGAALPSPADSGAIGVDSGGDVQTLTSRAMYSAPSTAPRRTSRTEKVEASNPSASPKPGPTNAPGVATPTAVAGSPTTAAMQPTLGPTATSAPQPNPIPIATTPIVNGFTQLTAGDRHNCRLQADGTVQCWGADDKGQSTPPAGEFLSVSAGSEHTCGISEDHTISCWGNNEHGQSAPPPGEFTALSAGSAHTCALPSDGIAACWGSNEFGQTTPPAGQFIAVSSGGEHTCGLRAEGAAECWGDNFYGQYAPRENRFLAVSAGYAHTCGIKQDETIACWGANPDGRAPGYVEGPFKSIIAGNRNTCAIWADDQAICWGDVEGRMPDPSEAVVAIGVGESHICWIYADGTADCDGDNLEGQATPPGGPTYTYSSVSAGANHTCGLRRDASVVCWGRDEQINHSPTDGSFESVSAGRVYNCAVRTGGRVICWGNNDSGAAFPPRGSFQTVSAGGVHTCGVRTDGTVACWGAVGYDADITVPPEGTFQSVNAGRYHTCGVRTDETLTCWGRPGHLTTFPPEGTFLSVSAAGTHICGLRTDGAVACWGHNGESQSTPPEGTFQSVSAGENAYTCGLRTSEEIMCWGRNEGGQATPPKGDFQSVSSGTYHNCGVLTDGTAMCWGSDRYGQATPP